MTTHAIYFTGTINASTVGIFQGNCLQALHQGATEIQVFMSSEGGSTVFGFTLYNFIRSLPVPVHMHNLGSVESMGNIAFLAADRRTASVSSRFIFHPLHWSYAGGQVDHSRLSEHAMSLESDLERYADIVLERTKGADEILDIHGCLRGTAKIISPAAAIGLGLITGVEDVSLPAGTPAWWVNS